MTGFADRGQAHVDMAVRALAWSVYRQDNAEMLAEMAVGDTGLGNVQSKILKNQRKTFGTLRDLLRTKTVGLIDHNPDLGLSLYGKPVGIVGAVCPSTNPSATPVNKAMMAIKGGNSVIIAPSPAAYRTTAKTVSLMRAELARAAFPEDLVQLVEAPVTKSATQCLLESVDLAVVTGSQDNVRRAMASGTVSIGVGAGNVPVIIDSSADLNAAARRIAVSKTFDNATSCSSENSVIILDPVYRQTIEALQNAGGWLCSEREKSKIAAVHWQNGKLNRDVIGKGPDIVSKLFELPLAARKARFFLVEDEEVGKPNGFADEKLSLVLTVYRAADFDHALELVRQILSVKGRGHSVGIHTARIEQARPSCGNNRCRSCAGESGAYFRQWRKL